MERSWFQQNARMIPAVRHCTWAARIALHQQHHSPGPQRDPLTGAGIPHHFIATSWVTPGSSKQAISSELRT